MKDYLTFKVVLQLTCAAWALTAGHFANASDATYPRAILIPDAHAPPGAKGSIFIVAKPGATPVAALPGSFSDLEPVVSPDGKLFAFDSEPQHPGTRPQTTQPASKLIVSDWSGHIFIDTDRLMTRNWGENCHGIDRVEWVDNARIGIGCFGGTLYTYSTILYPTAAVGVSYVSYLKSSFNWSPNRQHVAYVFSGVHYPPSASRSDVVMIDDKPQALATGRAHKDTIHSITALAWSPDGHRIAWLDSMEACNTDKLNTVEQLDSCEPQPAGTQLGLSELGAKPRTMLLSDACAGGETSPAPPISWFDNTHIRLKCGDISTTDRRLQPASN